MSINKFEFTDNVMYLKGVGPKRAKSLEKLKILTMYDLLTHYPRAYEDWSKITPIRNLEIDSQYVVVGRISELEMRIAGSGLKIISAYLYDGTGYIKLMWFNQEYIMDKLSDGMRLLVIGKVKIDNWTGERTMNQINSFSILDEEEVPEVGIMPIYPATATLNQNFFRKSVKTLLEKMPKLEEILPEKIIKELNLIKLDDAARWIHFPRNLEELHEARKRLAFDELFLIQCGLMLIKKEAQDEKLGIKHEKNGELFKKVQKSLPFELTGDQKKTLKKIVEDMENVLPMRRLIQGDVGSGKTVIAMLALVKTVENGYQGALMAPTEILATQHYEKFSKILGEFGIKVGLLSRKTISTKKRREELYKKIFEKEIDILIGTHAILEEGVKFSKLGLVVTDEQHRFGVSQRSNLEKKSEKIPDMLVMTATPIPRTMVLTVYGDLDVSLIKELPPGRKPIKTYLKTSRSREKVYEFVFDEIRRGRQAYVVCPLIERSESELLNKIDPAIEIYEKLSKGRFKSVKCGLIHGKLKSKEKDEVMEKFRLGEIKLLISTTVIEVGVDVPNATVMVIENAERYGLAQLHQLRGRVGRGSENSYCILISDEKKERLRAMEKTTDGFKLAEIDLKLRGPGEFFGETQHGLPDLKIADVFRDVEVLVAASEAAEKFVKTESDLKYYTNLRKNLAIAYGEKFKQITES